MAVRHSEGLPHFNLLHRTYNSVAQENWLTKKAKLQFRHGLSDKTKQQNRSLKSVQPWTLLYLSKMQYVKIKHYLTPAHIKSALPLCLSPK